MMHSGSTPVSARCHLRGGHKHDHNKNYIPEPTGMVCVVCHRPVYCDESYARSATGDRHVRCSHGRRDRPDYMPRVR